jgi:hypothetical protein
MSINSIPEDRSKQLLPILIGGHLFFFLYTSLSLLFFQERLSFDAAHYLYEIVTTKTFFIAHGRFIGVVSQFLPLLGSMMHLSLLNIIKLYSFNDVLYYYLLFILIIFKYKEPSAALMLILTLCLSVKFTFYCPVSELLQGMALLPLLYSMLKHPKKQPYYFIVLILFLLITSHPLTFFPTAFMLFAMNKNEGQNISFNRLYFFFILFMILKFTTLDKYDFQKTYYPVVFNDYSTISNLRDVNYLLLFLKMLIRDFSLLILMFLFTLISLFSTKDFRRMIIWLSGVFGFLLIIISTHRFTGLSNYSERMLLPLSVLVIIPFSEAFFSSRIVVQRIGFLLITAIILFRLEIIHLAAKPYTLRIELISTLINQAKELNLSKVIIDDDKVEQASFAMTGWCYPIESIILSSVDSNTCTVSLALKKEHIQKNRELGLNTNSNQWIKWSGLNEDDNFLPNNYFSLKPSSYTSLLSPGVVKTGEVNLEVDSVYHRIENDKLYTSLFLAGNTKQRVHAENLFALVTTCPIDDPSKSVTKQFYIDSDFIKKKQQFIVWDDCKAINVNYSIEVELYNGENHDKIAEFKSILTPEK